jgi:gluconate transporter
MVLVWAAAGIGLMLILMLVVRLDAFFSLLITCFAVGLLNGMDLLEVLQSVLKGVTATLGSVVLILVFGAMLGRLIDESGAAHAITYKLIELFGIRNVQFALLATGFLVGLPMLYNAGLLVLIPLVYTLSVTTRLPLIYLGLPVAAGLSVTHGFLPPHPAPTAAAFLYGADVNKTLLLGLFPTILAALAGGIVLPRLLRRTGGTPPPGLYEPRHFEPHQLPGLGVSLFTALIPMLLMLVSAVGDIALGTNGIDPFAANVDYRAQIAQAVASPALRDLVTVLKFVGNANVALALGVLTGLYTLGVRQGRKMDGLMKSLGTAAASIAMIMLIIGAGGAFSQVLRDSGVAEYVKVWASGVRLNPLLLAFTVATLLRVAVGSATVASLTTAGMLAPLAAASGVRPELMVLATGAGSLMFSHMNDTGFWMFKEYFNVSVKETFAVWTTMETVVGVVGLGATMILYAVL